jgi:hypothetical protein
VQGYLTGGKILKSGLVLGRQSILCGLPSYFCSVDSEHITIGYAGGSGDLKYHVKTSEKGLFLLRR